MAEFLLLALAWAVPVILLFFVVYWAVRLAIRHESRRRPSRRDLDRDLHERVTAEREQQHQEWEAREATKGEPPDS